MSDRIHLFNADSISVSTSTSDLVQIDIFGNNGTTVIFRAHAT